MIRTKSKKSATFRLCRHFLFCLCLIFCLWGIPVTAAEETGTLSVSVTCQDNEFQERLVINLIRSTGENCLVTIEPINGWKADQTLPIGDYTVDHVGIQGNGESGYEAVYTPELTIAEGRRCSLEIQIRIREQAAAQESRTLNRTGTEDLSNATSVEGRSGNGFAESFLKRNAVSAVLLAVGGLVLLVYRQRKEQ